MITTEDLKWLRKGDELLVALTKSSVIYEFYHAGIFRCKSNDSSLFILTFSESELSIPFDTKTSMMKRQAEAENKPNIRTFPSGAVRSCDKGRPRIDYISVHALEALGQHLANNANDFGPENYLLGIPEQECLASLLRHYVGYKKTNSKKDAVSILFNAVALVHTICINEEKK